MVFVIDAPAPKGAMFVEGEDVIGAAGDSGDVGDAIDQRGRGLVFYLLVGCVVPEAFVALCILWYQLVPSLSV